MQLLAWNCQGMGSPLTVRVLGELNRKHRLDLVFLSETKQKQGRLEGLRRRWGFAHGEYVLPEGTAGGLAVWGSSAITWRILGKSRNFIDLWVHSKIEGCSFFLTLVYGCPLRSGREEFFSELSLLGRSKEHNWVVLGDFNAYLLAGEKEGRWGADREVMQWFGDFMSDCGMVDLGYNGGRFTWTNRRRGAESIKERIDRAVCGSEWRIHFPNAVITHENFLGSDHRPIVLHTDFRMQRFHRQFRFEQRWVEHSSCEQVIRRSWLGGGRVSPQRFVVNNLCKLHKVLGRWSKRECRNSKHELVNLQQELSVLEETGEEEGVMRRREEVTSRIRFLLQVE